MLFLCECFCKTTKILETKIFNSILIMDSYAAFVLLLYNYNFIVITNF